MDKSGVDWRTQVKVESMHTYTERTSVSLHFSHVRYKKDMITRAERILIIGNIENGLVIIVSIITSKQK